MLINEQEIKLIIDAAEADAQEQLALAQVMVEPMRATLELMFKYNVYDFANVIANKIGELSAKQ